MNRTNNQSVISSWASGVEATNHKNTLRTDGNTLWSYNLVIGYTTHRFLPTGALQTNKDAIDYTAPSGNFRSMTTSSHVGRAKAIADRIVQPS
jgi:hypothetical protein